jgi:hypothetical protein
MLPQINIKLIFSSEHYYKEEFRGEYEFYVVFSHSNEYYIFDFLLDKETISYYVYIFDFLLDKETISYYVSSSKFSYYNESCEYGFEYKPKKI